MYFDVEKIKGLDDLKKGYFLLAKKYHPDTSGYDSKKDFQQLQAEYHELTNSFLTGSGMKKQDVENEIAVDEAYQKVINELIKVEDITVEVIGTWIWVSGNTYPIRETIKKLGFHFAPVKKMWYINTTGIPVKRHKETIDIDQIRKKYGSFKFDPKGQRKLSGLNTGSMRRLKNSLSLLIKRMKKRG